MNYNRHFIILQLLFSVCLCEISVDKKEKLLNGFISFYNSLPGQLYKCDEGTLETAQEVDETTYQIVANLKVKELNGPDVTKLFKCTAKLKDSDNGVTVENNHCEDQELPENDSKEVTGEPIERTPIKLENEVQSDTALTSGEQFIAIPRNQPNTPCVGCSSHVSPQAAGVSDLANLGIRHLDIHEPFVKHSLDSVLDVERQVQVVNGVRYILTQSVIFDKCGEHESQDCASSKICKITILVKPWAKLPNGKNYRAILANNCTEEWQYGDDGEVVPELTSNNHGSDDDILVKNNKDLQSQPNQQKTLSDEEIRIIQDQIIPDSHFEQVTVPNHDLKTTASDVQDVSKQHVFKLEANKQSVNAISVTESVKTINQEKKKAIDELLDFFDFSGFKPEAEYAGINPRIKRSYANDLQVLSLAEDYNKIKKSIENAKFVYEMAQAMVDYLNEMDIYLKNRVIQEVLKAEEETENFKRFVYVQARVMIPCDKIECEPKDGTSQICNGVIDSTNEHSPQILNTFCYNSNKEKDYRDVVKEVYSEDPVLQTLAKEAVKKIESESKSPYAIKLNKIVAANTQTTSGTLSKISMIIENLNCNKSVPFGLRINCTVLEQLGSKICEVLIHERYWLQEKKISYTCTDRPVDMKMSKTKSIVRNITVDDPKIIEMLQEAIQYLETQSNKNNKQKILNVTSISTQIVAGFLTKLEFIVGYTNCTNDNEMNCELLENENLRICKAQIWDRSWIIDGKQIEVLCNDMAKADDIEKTKKKRSIDVENQKEQNVNNITYKQLAEESLKKVLQSSKQHYVVVSVEKVKNVSGMLTLIDFTITPTNCLIEKDGNPTLKKCEVVNLNDKTLCHSKILGEIWLQSKQYFVSCDAKYRNQEGKNNLIGLKEHDPSDSKYYQLANESLTKYFIDRGMSRHHRIVRVEKATTQIVSGLLTNIDFIISPNESNSSSDNIKCHSQVLEKHWLKSKDYDITCEIKENKNIEVVSKPDTQQLTQIAVESLQEYIKHKPDSQLLRVTFVDKATMKPTGTNVIEFLASHSEDNDGDTFCHAEFLQKSLVRNYVTVKCDSIGTVLKKSEITEEDSNYFQYIKLAEESLKKYLQINNQSDLYTIVSIDNISVKWDKGISTEIKFIVSPIDLDNNELRGLQCTSQIREQPWLNKNYVNVTCGVDKDLYRVKRQLDGSTELKNPTDPKYNALADESLQKYLTDNNIREFHKVDSVEKVTTQVVSGSLTRIDFIISNGQNLKAQKCHSEVWEQPWLDKKEITVSCSPLGQREKRDEHITGGETTQDPNNPKYKALADESLQKYLTKNNIGEFHKVDNVESVTTQVVSGSLTRIDFIISNGQNLKAQKCHSEVWEQPWLNKKEITVSCSPLGQREKRDQHIKGGETNQDPNDPKYNALADESLQKYLTDNNIREFHKVDSVEKVTTQVVSGSLTRIDFIISNGQNLKAQYCHSKVWEQPWLNNKEITVSCSPLGQREKRDQHIKGGETNQDPNNPKYKALADESLQKYLTKNNIGEFHKVDSVESVTTQVVSGSLTRIDFIISNGQNLKAQKCHSEVWEQPWLNKKEITVSCSPLGQREKRDQHIKGGETNQDPNDPKFNALADESLQKYLTDNNIREFHKVDSVEKVTTQVVSGSLTRIDFIISNGQNLKAQYCHSEVWEQPWLDNKEITVSCSPLGQREKRDQHITGGETNQDPNNPKYKALADESLQKYLTENNILEFRKVDSVEKVTTQVVSGSLTRIDFIISNGQNLKAQKCHSEVWEQPWLNKKEITVSCSPLGQREKRDQHIKGGETNQDPNDPKYNALADESLQKYLTDNNIREFHKVDSVEKVTTQVVSGSLTRIDFIISNGQNLKAQYCHSKVWEQPWLNNKEITVSCSPLGQREKRDQHIKGGETNQDPNNPKYKALADESLQKYLTKNNIGEFHKVDSVESVTTQVVSGSLTRIDFIISNGQNLKAQKCHSEVWEQPWLNKKEITVSCSPLGQREKRDQHIKGGETNQDPNDPKYNALADESLQKYLTDNNIREFHKVDSVEKVTTQVVSGSLTRIDFIISNGQNLKAQYCHSKVWEQPWLNNKEITVSCSPLGQREKRDQHIKGGETNQDPNNPKYKALADESLQKYLTKNNIGEFHKVDSVESVTTQVVSGSLTRIDFIISNGQNLKAQKCHSEVWEQPWLNKKEITVSCSPLGQREKRDQHIKGGETNQDPNDPKFNALADESLQKYLTDNNIREFHKVDSVEKVTTQVVSGSLTRIDFIISNGQNLKAQYCHSEVWEQPWLDNKEITVSCSPLGQREKRDQHITGGETNQDPNNPKYKALADESLQKYLTENNILEFRKVDSVEKVTTQVVSGSLTRIDFIISNGQNLKAQKCHSEVWEQPWLNKKEITVSCSPLGQREKRDQHIKGGETNQDPNDPKYNALADESLQKYLTDNNIREFHKVDSVEKVTTQVVSGSLTRIDFIISNGQNLKAQYCHSKVWEQPWLNNKEITVSCSPLGQREKRDEHITGGETNQDPNNPKYKALADESLQKYLTKNNIHEFHKVDSVESVTTQVVSGSLTRIDFIISNGQNLKAQKCHSEVWEQPWLNKKEITVSCSPLGQREKRDQHIKGGETNQDPNNPKYKALADESLQKYLTKNNIGEFHKVDSVESVTTQVVSGSLTRIDFIISNGQNLKAQYCHSKVWEQPWLNKKEITVSCSPLGQREKRDQHITGGETNQDPNNPKYKALADESLQKYLTKNNIGEFHKVDSVESVTTQVVSGSLTRIDFIISNGQNSKAKKCHSEVWEQPWLNKKEITVSCSVLGKREKRQEKLLGGETNQDPNDPKYKALVDESLQKYLTDNNIREFHKVDSVESVTTQIVSGSLTRIDFIISNGQNSKAKKCHSEVWEQPWLNKKEITVSCSPLGQREKRDQHITGGETNQDPNNPKYKALADESLQKYLTENNILEFRKVDSVEKVTTQVVSGSLTRIDLIISNGQNLKAQKCHSEVWEQPWLNKKEITVSCSPLGQREKRDQHIKGGETNQDPNDPKYNALADESLQKYLTDNNIREFHKVDSVEKVTTQVVSGSLTRIDFIISNGQNLKAQYCHSKVWEQPWLDNKEITVSCSPLGQREKRDEHITGGETNQDPNNPKYKALADESLQKYLTNNNIGEFHKVDSVESVTTQVVSGSLTRIDFIISNGQNLKAKKCHSEVWEQPWLNKKEITVYCSPLGQREKRDQHITGGETNQDPNNPKYKALADESLQKYLTENNILEFRKVDSVEKVTTQVVSGSLTRIDFIISNGQNLKAQYCHSKVWEQPWLNNKEITVSCSPLGQREKRDQHITGGETNQDPNNPKYKALADESLQKYLTENNILEFRKVDSVEKVTTQVVSGSLTRIDFIISNGQNLKAQYCHSKVWEQPWLNNKEITVSCSPLGQREKRDQHITGGETNQDPNNPKYKALADESLQKYLTKNNIGEFHKVDSVESVTTQVVSGSLTRIDFIISNGQNLKAQKCHSEVWEQPWLNNKEITVSCSLLGQRKKRDQHIKGGETNQDPNDSKYKVLAHESLQKYLTNNNIHEFHKVDSVESVTTQVVSGSLTRIDFTISNGENLKAQKCHSEVWEQPWLNKKEITVSCSVLGKREKRQEKLLGGETNQDPNDPKYKVLADESLQKYLTNNNIHEFHKVDSVESVTTQVVSGSLTRIDFTISNGENLKAQKCHSEVWEQPWLNKKEITVSCSVLGKREKRQEKLLGGETNQDPNDPKYKVLADESLQKYLTNNNIHEFHKVDSVESVTTQVVSGSLTRIDFTISNGENLKAQKCHSKVWEQPWLNKKEITVSCSLLGQRKKRGQQMAGGETNQDPNDPKYKVLADESLQKYLTNNNIHEFHKVDSVESVTTQVVSGSLTRIDFTISNGENLKAQKCHSEVWEQPWLNKKEITVSCSVLGKREKRQEKLLGGETNQDPNDPKYKALVDESLQKYLTDNNIREFHKVDSVEKVTTQVVSGSLTRIDFTISNRENMKAQKCHSKVWEQPWLNKKEITVSCSLLGQRKKRDQQMAGGETNQDPNDPKYKVLADESLQKYLTNNNIHEFHKVDSVESVTTQVVSGSLTRIDFTISNGENLKAQKCHSEVWEQPWLNKKEITVSCSVLGKREKRQEKLLGGETNQDPNDPKYKALVDESLQKYLTDNNIREFHKVDSVESVTTQVVSGSLTRIDFTISNRENLKAQKCHSKVWEQPWLNKKEITVSCSVLGKREKRQEKLLGGETNQDPNDPKYKVLADESLQKYLTNNNIHEFHKVDSVESVTTQVVSGSLTRIDFTISNGENLKAQKCHSKVWEQPWLNKKEITVSCSLLGQRKKRDQQMAGGETNQDPNDPKYKVLADESLQKYLTNNNIHEFHKVDSVESVTTQVVSGSLTRIDFTISNGENLKAQKCHSKVWEQPWLNKKEITVSCSLLGQRKKRDQQMAGGETNQDPNDPKYKVLADESLQKYLTNNNIHEFHKVDSVESVTTQVVSGSLTRIDFTISNGENLKAQKCHSEVWEQPWLNKKEITVSCSVLGKREKRQEKLLGGETNQDPNDPKYKVLADESLQKYLTNNNIHEFHKVDSVESVTTQVVSGSLTRIDFTISNGENLKAQKCHSKVWEQPWLNKKEITVSCSPLGQREKRDQHIKGGETNQDPNNPKYKALADESLQKYLTNNNIHEFHKVDSVESVTTQVVSGSLTRIDFTISNGENLKAQKCHSKVWEQPWLNKKEITVSCSLLGQRKKRDQQMAGGETNQDPNDPKYKVLADESLQKYLTNNNIHEFHKVDSVESVTTQVVSGSLTRIDFTISNGENLKAQKCHSEVWEQPWLNKKEITVSCSVLGKREKRQEKLLGGETNQDPNDPKYKVLADESLQKYLTNNNIHEFHKVDSVESVTTQVVSGSLTRIDFTISNGENLKAQKCHSKVWEQPWLNKKEITVSCSLLGQRKKRDQQMAGGETNQDPNDPKYKVLADESLQKYLTNNNIHEFHKVDSVESVTTQVVSGSLTRIDFTISNGENLKAQKCHSEVWEQPWLNKKEITVSCSVLGKREKRQEKLLGGETNQDPNDPKYKVLADESLQKYLTNNNIHEFHKVDSVESVTTQVVSGSLTRIDFTISNGENLKAQKCHSKVWEQPWLNKKEITVSCSLLGQRKKRDQQMAGGETNQDPNDPKYKVLADESLQKYLTNNNIHEFHKVDSVESVTTQVVAGSLTRIDFTISNGENLKAQKCHSKVWEQPWLNKKEITVSCSLLGQRKKRDQQMAGGETNQDPNDPKYKVLADESLQKYLTNNNIHEFHKVDSVESVTTQVVSGSLTRIDFTISNGENLKAQKCHSEVWEQPWLNKKEITVSCSVLGKREKRQEKLLGGETNQDPNDPKYKALVDESLQKYLTDNNIREFHKVDSVESVTTQVVSGSLTRIDFTISNGDNLKAQKCHSEVWEQPWLNKKEITVSCSLLDHRVKRQEPLIGGVIRKDLNDPKYKALANDSLQKYLTDNNISEIYKIDSVESVTTQVVSGFLTRLEFVISNEQNLKAQKCRSQVWEQPWLQKSEIIVSCSLLDIPAKDQEPLEDDVNYKIFKDPKYKALANESLQKYLTDNNISEFHKVDSVESVTTQVIVGSLTRIDFIISNEENLKAQKCNSEVWEHPSLDKKKITVLCSPLGQREKRDQHIKGGETNQDPNDPKYKALADESLQKYLTENNIREFHKVDSVESVTTQVVSGSLTRIDFIISNGENLKTQRCHSEVWEQPWLNNKEIIVSCRENLQRRKRDVNDNKLNKSADYDKYSNHLRGQEEEQDAHKAEYKLLAEESLQKFQIKNSTHHKVIEVKRVLTRVVSGIKYKIDFSAAPTTCPGNVSKLHVHKCKVVEGVILYCHSEIWDRPWLKQKKINVQCYEPNYNDFDDYVSDADTDGALNDILKLSREEKTHEDKFKLLAEEASEKYLTTSNRKYVHKVTHIHSVSEHIANGNIIKLEFSMSPTKCLRNETKSSNDTCEVKLPLIVLYCTAKILERPWLHVEKDIKITCKKLSKSKKYKRELGTRTVRQTGDEDDIDEETTYYYADRAVQHVNDQSSSNNLHKLVTIHAVQYNVQMKTPMIRMYIELAETYCLRHHKEVNLHDCEEMNGLDHRLCLARLWPSPDDELVIRHVSVICDDDEEFTSVTALNIPELLKLSMESIERSPENHFKLIHQGEPQVIPALDSKLPIQLNFIIATTNCSKNVDLDKNPFQCFIDGTIPAKACSSLIWMDAEIRTIRFIDAKCPRPTRSRRSPLGPANVTADNLEIQNLVTESLEKLEMSSLHRYKQRVLQINSHSTKITSGKVTTIDFDVGYTSCLKYEWVENITSCDFLEHLPRRRCVAQIFERLWINNGRNIDVNCVDDETPLESHIEFESAEMANELASEALKHIEAKYPHPKKQKVVRIFSLEKQVVAGIHYRMKVEVGFTDCVALSEQTDCKLENDGINKFCRVNVWIRPWTDHPPNFRVSCDYQEGATHDLYHHVQAEHLFYNFLTTYSPSYVNDYSQMQKRFEIFKSNVKKIHELNVYEKGTARYGVTRFTDLTYEEFSTRYMGLKTDLRDANQVPMKKAEIPDIKIPQNFDWREYDAVTDVKDQGSCGSCWAFSVTGNIEGQWKMQSGQLVSLSEQELVDCDKLDNGCNGGLPDNAYRAIEQLGGLELEIDYPYEGEDDKCLFNKTLAKVQISGAVNITTNETGMAQWLVHNGPISIGINANAMQFYMGGISHPWKMLCNPTNLDHGVLVVGYGVKDYPLFHKRLPYWIVKNSWGKSWGEQGYYRVYRGDGTCGVNQMASSAVI